MRGWKKSLEQPLGHTGFGIREGTSNEGYIATPVPPYIYVELGPSSPIPNPFPFSMDMAHGCVRETIPNRPSHNAQAFDMSNHIREHRKKQSHIRQSPSSHEPWGPLWLRQKRGTHGFNGSHSSHGWANGLWDQLRAIQARSAYRSRYVQLPKTAPFMNISRTEH
jgi:hypothetical protein